jgi:hypothetical protein
MKCFISRVLICLMTLSMISAKNPATKPVKAEGTGEFRVQGTRIIDPQGNDFIMKGTGVNGWGWVWPRETTQDADLIANVWKFNTIRVSCYIKREPQFQTNLDLNKIVDEFATKRKVVTILETHDWTGTYPDDADLEFLKNWWVDKANRYKDNTYVWFNIMNEPGNDVLNERWRVAHEEVIKAIRSTGATNIIICDGSTWGQETGRSGANFVSDADSAILSYGQQVLEADPLRNTAFSVHMYGNWNLATTDKFTDYITKVHNKGLSISIGEYGVWVNQEVLYYETVKNALVVANQKGIGRIVWHWDGGDRNDLTTGTSQGGGWEINKTDGTKPTNLSWMGSKTWDDNHGIVPAFDKDDLAVDRLLPDKTIFNTGEQLQFQATLVNNGDLDLVNKKLKVIFKVNGQEVSSKEVTVSLPRGRFITVVSDKYTTTSQSFNAEAVIDTAASGLNDINLENNRITAMINGRQPQTGVDLVVKDIRTDKAEVNSGDEVSLQVTVKNQGTEASSTNFIGGSFYINGRGYTWERTEHQSLAPGQEVILTGRAKYKASEDFELGFTMDDNFPEDVNRNNMRIFTQIKVKKLTGVNLLTNGNFENGTTGWSNWGRREITTDVVYTGTRALRVSSGGTGGGGNNIDLKPNTTYILSAWGKNDAPPTASSDVGFQYRMVSGGEQTKFFLNFTETEWTYKQIMFTTGNTILAGDGNVFVWKSARDVNFYVDDIVLVEVPNLLSNGNFENGTTGWSNWGRRESTTEVVRTGTRALKVASGGTGGGGNNIDLKPNTTYILGAWGKNDALPTASSDVGFQYRMVSGGEQTKFFLNFTETEWTYKQIMFTTGNTILAGDGNVFVWKNSRDVNFYVDDIVLVEVPNLLSNGNFENGTTGWSNWGRRESTTEVVRTGTRALKVASGGTGGGGNNLDLKPNTTYILSAWGKNDITPTSGSSDVGFQYRMVSGGVQTKHFLHFTETEWTYKQIMFTTGNTILAGDGNVFVWKNSRDVNFYIDDIVLTEVPTLMVNPVISTIANLEREVDHNAAFELPSQVEAVMSDGTTKNVAVTWAPASADTSNVGSYTFEGTVAGYNEKVTLTLKINAVIVSIENIDRLAVYNKIFDLPETLEATMSDGTTRLAPVNWNLSAINDRKPGKTVIEGTVEGYDEKIRLTVIVTGSVSNKNK